ncbi:DNA methyltransferase [Sphaerospermopsis sp. LEGE 00249]|uniref:DNA methyltransferase n=1 Tax=Sphaerospermopsis sp. LEGE 00249 TaxID=1380707 RepID=UPI00210494BD|nr:DNA methyltransferase [Sphaerospermopsis sp. LEGE 00249]
MSLKPLIYQAFGFIKQALSKKYLCKIKSLENKTLSTTISLIADIFNKINMISYDKKYIPQEKLDLKNKTRTSILPWRGQFSPELVELFIKVYSNTNHVVLDPFAGSGTTLFEAARQGLSCYGTDINPAAVEMAKTAHFINLKISDRERLIKLAETIVAENLLPFTGDLFFYGFAQEQKDLDQHEIEEKFIFKILKQAQNEELLHNLLVNAIINYSQQRQPRNLLDFKKSLQKHINIIKSLPYSLQPCNVIHQDARYIPLTDHSVDIVITSPPYINVFNYHQNNRRVMEMLGWDLLTIAKSEIGANRKHRQNRFLTVVQYALDMLDVLKEIRRLISKDGRVILIIGRESSVRGVRFENSKLVAALAIGGAGFEIDLLQERKFQNKFGEIIYEDILHLLPINNDELVDDNFATELAIEILTSVSKNAESDIYKEIIDAKKRAKLVHKSPLFKINNFL